MNVIAPFPYTPTDVPIQPEEGTYTAAGKIPSEVWANIFFFLSPLDRVKAASICSKFRFVLAMDHNSQLAQIQKIWRLAHTPPTIQPLDIHPEIFFSRVLDSNCSHMLFYEWDIAPSKLIVVDKQTGAASNIDLREAVQKFDKNNATSETTNIVLAARQISDTTIVTYSSGENIDWWELDEDKSHIHGYQEWHCATHMEHKITSDGLKPDAHSTKGPNLNITARITDKKLYIEYRGDSGEESFIDEIDLTSKKVTAHHVFKGEPCPRLSMIFSDTLYSSEWTPHDYTLKAIHLRDGHLPETKWELKGRPGPAYTTIEANDRWVVKSTYDPLSWVVIDAATGHPVWKHVDHPIGAHERQKGKALITITMPTVHLHKNFLISQKGTEIRTWDIGMQRCIAIINTKRLPAYDQEITALPLFKTFAFDQEIHVLFFNEQRRAQIARYRDDGRNLIEERTEKGFSMHSLFQEIKRLALTYLCNEDPEETK